jgi:hypothetical protein
MKCKYVLLYPVRPSFRKGTAFWKVFRLRTSVCLSVCLSGNSNMKMSTEHWGNDTDRGKTEVLGEKPIPVPLRLPQISHGLAWYRARASVVIKSKINLYTDRMGQYTLSVLVICQYVSAVWGSNRCFSQNHTKREQMPSVCRMRNFWMLGLNVANNQ